MKLRFINRYVGPGKIELQLGLRTITHEIRRAYGIMWERGFVGIMLTRPLCKEGATNEPTTIR